MRKNNDFRNVDIPLTTDGREVLPGTVSPPVPQTREKERPKDQVKEPPAKRRSLEREER
ncbi:DUF4316 domain-containing protein [Paenibacillus sp. RS8]|uniref:DUF4316 domain-containing protein n=1 Tax=Paenibacillus sp. RS8 TaxID=3242681 RepID=UPI0035C1AFEC